MILNGPRVGVVWNGIRERYKLLIRNVIAALREFLYRSEVDERFWKTNVKLKI